MKIFLNTSARRTYYLTQDTDKTIAWELGPIESFVMMNLIEKFKNITESQNNIALMREVIRHGLKGVKGQSEGQDIVIEFEEVDISYLGKFKVVADKFLNNLNLVVITELATEIINDNTVREPEAKNS